MHCFGSDTCIIIELMLPLFSRARSTKGGNGVLPVKQIHKDFCPNDTQAQKCQETAYLSLVRTLLSN